MHDMSHVKASMLGKAEPQAISDAMIVAMVVTEMERSGWRTE